MTLITKIILAPRRLSCVRIFQPSSWPWLNSIFLKIFNSNTCNNIQAIANLQSKSCAQESLKWKQPSAHRPSLWSWVNSNFLKIYNLIAHINTKGNLKCTSNPQQSFTRGHDIVHINPLHGVGYRQSASKISITVHLETMSPPLIHN